MLRILFFLCVTLFAVDGRVMGATNVFCADTGRLSHSSRIRITEINEKLHDSTKVLSDVEKAELELKRAIECAKFLRQKNSPEINKAAIRLNDARIKEVEALRQAEEQQRECLLEEKRNRINGLTNEMSAIYQEIYRGPLAKVLSTKCEDIFMTHYDAAFKKQTNTQTEVTSIVVAINEALRRLDIEI